MLIRKNIILLLLLALHAGADVFKTNEIPVVPAEDLVPPPEDQESLLVKYGNQQGSKSFFQRIVTWFGFNGDPQSQSTNVKNAKKQPQKQQSSNGGYMYENPAKPFSAPPPQKFSSPPTYDPTKVIISNGFRFEPAPPQKYQSQGYTYEPPPQKLELQPEAGYTYDPPQPPQPVKLQALPVLQQPTGFQGYTYNPPPVKLQQPPPTGYTYGAPPPVKLQEPSHPQQPTGYNYDPPPVKLQQKPVSLNDLVSSAASPTALYAYNSLPINQFNQAQTSDSFPCNKIPWLPMFPSAHELNLLRQKLQAKNPTYLQSVPGYQNIQSIPSKPPPEKFVQHLNAHTYLPPRQRPLRQPSASQVATPNQINSINSLPLQSTAQPFRAPVPTLSTGYLPIQTTQQTYVPIPVPNLSATPVPPLYDPKPFSLNDAQPNGIYINGRLVTPTGLSTTSVQSLQVINQNHPVTQPQRLIQPTNSYGTPVTSYGTPPVTYGPPTNTYGTPPVKLTAEVTESSVFSRFSASQPFTARPTLSSFDQTRLSTNMEQNSNLMEKPIIISDNAADASEATRSPQDANAISDENLPILQVLQELNVTTTPQGFQYSPSSTEPSISLSSASQVKKNEKVKANGDRETPLDLLDTPIHYFRKTSIGPSSTPNPNGDRVPDFKFMRNTWKPLPPNPFSNPTNVVTTAAPSLYPSVVTPSAASAAFQSHTAQDPNAIQHNQDNDAKKTKKIQIIIPYTSKSRPSPFKNPTELQSFESSAGWSNSQHHDDHNSEESQVISSATPSPKPHNHAPKHANNSRYLTKILAKNIRELLKREHLKNISTIDLAKLQKNIDGWTEQEFSMSPNRASTISLLTQPKHIPFEYLTTTQSLQDILTTETLPTTEYPTTLYEVSDNTESDDSQDEGEVMDDESADENEVESQDNIAADEEAAIQQAEEIEDEDFKRLDYLKSLENHVSGTEHRIFYATNPPPPSPKPITTTPVPPCSTATPAYDNDSIARTTVLPSADELWNKLKSLLSASTDKNNEKVYIVTPQPYPYFESEKIVNDDDNEVVGNFKSPRFLVRPTPGASIGRSSNSYARLTFKPRAGRLQTTTVKTTWNESPNDPVTETYRSSTHSQHSFVNGHAHAQAFSYVTPRSFSKDIQVVDDENDENVDDDDDDDENNDNEFIDTETHRRSLHEYKH